MKKIILICTFLAASTTSFGQSVFDKYDGQDDVKAIIVNKKMFQLMSNVKMDIKDNDAQQFVSLIKKLDNLKVFTTSSVRATNEMKATATQHIKSAGLEELMRISDSGKNIKIMVNSGATTSQIKELLMFIEGSGKENETVLMSLTGDFDLDEISVLTDKMKIPGGDALKKAAKK
jgi:alpha-acetolactate decarboxylase